MLHLQHLDAFTELEDPIRFIFMIRENGLLLHFGTLARAGNQSTVDHLQGQHC